LYEIIEILLNVDLRQMCFRFYSF